MRAEREDQVMLFSVSDPLAVPAGHAGYVAGRYRDGAHSDEWTDVSRCAENTFVAYAPACSCGWRGPAERPTVAGRLRCRRVWMVTHLSALATVDAAGTRLQAG
jgi:hypothetical protein